MNSTDTALFEPLTNTSVPEFRKFTPFTEHKVTNIIMSMKSKHCELDSILTDKFKEILPSIISIVTQTANIRLERGIFVKNWKYAIVHPLLKKLGLELILKNY